MKCNLLLKKSYSAFPNEAWLIFIKELEHSITIAIQWGIKINNRTMNAKWQTWAFKQNVIILEKKNERKFVIKTWEGKGK